MTYDPSKVSYPQLVDWFWRNIDPVDAKGQFCDKGSPYYTGIFTHDEAQKKVAEESKQALEASGRFKEKIATKILPAGPFWVAEDYHQDYYKKNPHRYQYYKTACGRAARLEQIWGHRPNRRRPDAVGARVSDPSGLTPCCHPSLRLARSRPPVR